MARMTAAIERFIDLTPHGALGCAGAPPSDLRGRLLRALLLREPQRAWHGRELAQLLPDEHEMAARTLFGLHREGCLVVSLAPPSAEDRHWAAIQADLESIVSEGAQAAVLLDEDGLVIAQAGAVPAADDSHGPPWHADWSLHLGEGALHARYGLALQGSAPPASVVRLVRRLARLRETPAPA
jgi:hypothetical protein